MPDTNPFTDNPVGRGVQAVVGAVKDGASFVSDPFGFTAEKIAEANKALAENLLPGLLKATHPDYSQEWFVRAYLVAWAGGIILMCFILAWNFYLLGRGKASGRQLLDALGVGAPMFLVGAMFGPLFATLVLDATGALTDAMAAWAGTSTGEVIKHLADTIDKSSDAQVIGGSIVAIACEVALLLALFLILVTLLVLLVSQYLIGVVWPLAAVWWSSVRRKSVATTALMMWLTLALCPPLLFFLLGVGQSMIGGLGGNWSGGPIGVLANVFVAVVVLVMVGGSPWMLLRLAPIGLGATPDGAALHTSERGQGSAGSFRRSDPGLNTSGSHSGSAELARTNADSSGDEGGSSATPSSEPGPITAGAQRMRAGGGQSGTAALTSSSAAAGGGAEAGQSAGDGAAASAPDGPAGGQDGAGQEGPAAADGADASSGASASSSQGASSGVPGGVTAGGATSSGARVGAADSAAPSGPVAGAGSSAGSPGQVAAPAASGSAPSVGDPAGASTAGSTGDSAGPVEAVAGHQAGASSPVDGPAAQGAAAPTGAGGGSAAASSGAAGEAAAAGTSSTAAAAGPIGLAAAGAVMVAHKTSEVGRKTVDLAQASHEWLEDFQEQYPSEGQDEYVRGGGGQ